MGFFLHTSTFLYLSDECLSHEVYFNVCVVASCLCVVSRVTAGDVVLTSQHTIHVCVYVCVCLCVYVYVCVCVCVSVCVCVCVCVALLVIMRINIEHMMYVLDCSCIDIYVSTVVPPITISIWSQSLRPALTVRMRAHAFP